MITGLKNVDNREIRELIELEEYIASLPLKNICIEKGDSGWQVWYTRNHVVTSNGQIIFDREFYHFTDLLSAMQKVSDLYQEWIDGGKD